MPMPPTFPPCSWRLTLLGRSLEVAPASPRRFKAEVIWTTIRRMIALKIFILEINFQNCGNYENFVILRLQRSRFRPLPFSCRAGEPGAAKRPKRCSFFTVSYFVDWRWRLLLRINWCPFWTWTESACGVMCKNRCQVSADCVKCEQIMTGVAHGNISHPRWFPSNGFPFLLLMHRLEKLNCYLLLYLFNPKH